jgi:hypothetical protein
MPSQLDPTPDRDKDGFDSKQTDSGLSNCTHTRAPGLLRERAAVTIQVGPSACVLYAFPDHTFQKSYRGYRARRQIQGIGLDPDTRWSEALKELRFRARTKPVARAADTPDSHAHARSNWKLAAEAARHAASDDTSDTEGENGMTPQQILEYKKAKKEAHKELAQAGKMMDLQYWLEMVDHKHRYGANLRAYHNEWKKSDTRENFFYWLDHGEGRNLELPSVSRPRLEFEQVKYLSREERQHYLVRVTEGRLCWAKNGEPITTSPEFKDSIEGVVPTSSRSPTWSSKEANTRPLTASTTGTESTDFEDNEEGQHYVNEELQRTRGWKKFTKVNPHTILNSLLQKTVRPNTWIFVADTSFHLYVGIKKSGAFQHSSFLQGARIAAAGLIKIQDGQLRKLSPLSGHYRPPTKNFKLFVQSLQNAGVDMSHVHISRSYAILVGLETYVKTRKKIKNAVDYTLHGKDKVVHPEEAKKLKEEAIDKSNSAQREREVVEQEKVQEKQRRDSFSEQLKEKLRLHDQEGSDAPMSLKEAQVNPAARPQKDD